MPSKSKSQQRFFGMVRAAQKGGKPGSSKVASAAKSMRKSDVKKFASTKTKGLPQKKSGVPKKGSSYKKGSIVNASKYSR